MDKARSRFDQFTERAKRALALAQAETQRRGQAAIEPEHLLLGLLAVPGETACELLLASGVTPQRARIDGEALLPPVLPPEQATSGEIALSSRTKQVLSLAVEEVGLLKQSNFATGHFLLGMLREDGNGSLFANWGIDLESARASMLRLGQAGIAREQPPVSPAPPVPATTGAVEIDAAHQQKLTRVTRQIRNARMIFLLVLVVSLTTFILLPGFVLRLLQLFRALLTNPVLSWDALAGWRPLLVLFFSLLACLVLFLLVLPLAWYNVQWLLRRSGLVQTSTRTWLRGLLSTFLPFLCEFCVLLEVVTFLISVQPQSWWAWAALIVTLFYVLMGGWIGFYRFLWLAHKIKPLREGEIVERFHALRERLGLPACGFYQLNLGPKSRGANAFFAGWGKGRRVIITDSLPARFSPDEIEVILAHELGHFAYHDIWTRYLLNGLLFLGLFGLIALELSAFSLMGQNFADADLFSMLLRPLSLFVVLALLLIFVWFRQRYIRYQEDRADEYALRATNNVQAFKDAMTRLTNSNLIVAAPNKSASRRGTHPTLLKRLQHADEYAQKMRKA